MTYPRWRERPARAHKHKIQEYERDTRTSEGTGFIALSWPTRKNTNYKALIIISPRWRERSARAHLYNKFKYLKIQAGRSHQRVVKAKYYLSKDFFIIISVCSSLPNLKICLSNSVKPFFL